MRLRLQVVAGLFLCGLLAIYLGFADISLPHDKLLHFAMFFLMSLLFYWALESKSTAAWRNVAFVVCTLVGGIGSEYLQHYISPSRQFDLYDIVANVLGSASAIGLSSYYHSRSIKKERARRIRPIADIEEQLDLEMEDQHGTTHISDEHHPSEPAVTDQPLKSTMLNSSM